MQSWRDPILKEFVPNISKLTIVSDPDCLLSEEKLQSELRARGFAMLEFNDPLEFRYLYESEFRDKGSSTDLIIALRQRPLNALPYDLYKKGRRLEFRLADIFPNFSCAIVEKLDRGLLDKLFAAQLRIRPGRMGDNASMDFILSHVFGIATEVICSDIDLLRILLRIHYGKLDMPKILVERLLQKLNRFTNWPLADLIFDDRAFFAFLQERWPIFLAEHNGEAQEDVHVLKYAGPELLPFGHYDIKVYITNLFLEGKLSPVEVKGKIADAWMLCGVSNLDNEDPKIDNLFELVEKERPGQDSRYADWTSFACKWAELSSLVYRKNKQQSRLQELDDAINAQFAEWLDGHYASLINLSPAKPVMPHHVDRHMARALEDDPGQRLALLVVDGLALDQWVTLRQSLSDLCMLESAIFAWIPTLTTVSRQALFSGKPPFYLDVQTTNHEEKLWKQFWAARGIGNANIIYRRGLGDDLEMIKQIIQPQTKVAGLVVDKVDKMTHGIQLGSAGLHNQIQQWARDGFLHNLIKQLLADHFTIWLTSDHGNIECTGKGRPADAVIAETRGERARIYQFEPQVNLPFTRRWQPVGLPPNYYPLLAQGHFAFVENGQTVVSHGGIALQEVIVPFVKFENNG